MKNTYWAITTEPLFNTKQLTKDNLQEFDLMNCLNEGIGQLNNQIYKTFEQCYARFGNSVDDLPNGEYVIFRFHVKDEQRLMDGALAAAVGDEENSPFTVIIVESFWMKHTKN